MHIDEPTSIHSLIKAYPFLVDYLEEVKPSFKELRNPLLMKTVGRFATIGKAAAIGGIDPERLIALIRERIARETGVPDAEEAIAPVDREQVLKQIIRDLHDDVDVEAAKDRFREMIKDVDSAEIARMEQALMAEGMPEEEIKRLCDVHVEVFKSALDMKHAPSAPEGHPVHSFMQENRALETLLGDLVAKAESAGSDTAGVASLLDRVAEVNLHFTRKENQLFPLLEKHEVSGPSEVMWSIHDDIRKALKTLRQDVDGGRVEALVDRVKALSRTMRDMIYKEEHILFPLAIDLLTEEDWIRVRAGEEEIGYAWIGPRKLYGRREEGVPTAAVPIGGAIDLGTGQLTVAQLLLVFQYLPVEISVVDANDEVRYYSVNGERIFPRSPAVIGRKVQKCHPPKSMHMVQQILDDFRSGVRDTADFRIDQQGRFIHIRYIALRDADKGYQGTMEVVQDATGLRALSGEKRLLDE